jgi:hypothetical protein
MPIDARIPLMGQPAQFQSPLEAYQAVAQIQAVREATEARRQAAEERRQQAMDAAATKQRAEQVATQVRAAIKPHPTTGRMTIDWPTLLNNPNVPPDVLLKLQEETDQVETRAEALAASKETRENKHVLMLGALAQPVATAGYAQPAWEASVLTASRAGLITEDQRNEAYGVTDPAEIQRRTDLVLQHAEAIRQASGQKPDLQKVTHVNAQGQTVEEFVRPKEGVSYVQPTKTEGLPSYQDMDALVHLPDGTTFTGKVGYNPKTNTYAPIGSTASFPPGTKVEKAPTPVDTPDQGKLEQSYRTILSRAMSSRSGGIGLEDGKVQQANHLLALIDQSYDPKTGAYNIPKTQQAELALGLARLLSPGGQVGVQMMDEINQRTAKGDIAGLLTYVTGTPVSATPQAIAQMFKDSIERQGQVAQENREGSLAYLRALVPTDLDENRRQALESATLNPLRQSRLIEHPQTHQRVLQVSVDGGKTWRGALDPAPVPAPRAATPKPTTAGPGSDWTMVNGVLYYKGKPY